MHKVGQPKRLSRDASACRACVVIRAPVAPIGCPIETLRPWNVELVAIESAPVARQHLRWRSLIQLDEIDVIELSSVHQELPRAGTCRSHDLRIDAGLRHSR